MQDISQANKGDRIVHPHYGKGTVVKVGETILTVHFPSQGNMDISKRMEGLEYFPQEEEAESQVIDIDRFRLSMRLLLEEFTDITQTVDMAERFRGGTLIIQPADPALKAKELPIETFFHKIVMLRDRLRVLEQNINSHNKLDDQDKVHLQQYITRIYGSLTTFNVLFRHNKDHFVGEKTK